MTKFTGKISFETSLEENSLEMVVDSVFNDVSWIDIDSNGVVSVDFEIESDVTIDYSRCYQKPAYFDAGMEQWYPGDIEWNPIIEDLDIQSIQEDILSDLMYFDTNVELVNFNITAVKDSDVTVYL